MPARIEISVVLPQPLGPTSSVSSPGVDVQVDAAQRQDPRIAAAVVLDQAPAGHAVFRIRALMVAFMSTPGRRWPAPAPAPGECSAGWPTSTMTITATAVSASTCQGRKKASSGIARWAKMPYSVARPTPTP